MIAPIPNRDKITVQVQVDSAVDRLQWIQQMQDWAQQHGVVAHYEGYGTGRNSTRGWHRAFFAIEDEQQRSLFLLRWA